MTDAPLVSVVIPTYDRPDRVGDAVSNIREQTYRPIETIIVDDCSPTPVSDVIKDEFGSHHGVTIIRHDENQGANAARNSGIKQANGEYVAFLDDDDRWFPSKLRRQVDTLESAEADTAIAYTGKVYVNDEGLIQNVSTHCVSEKPTKQLLKTNLVGSFSTLLVHRDVFDDVGVLDEAFPCWQDTDFLVRATQTYDLACVPEPLTVRVYHGDQITGDFDARTETALPLFLEKHSDLANEYGDGFERQMRSRLFFNVGWNGVVNGHTLAAFPYILRAIRTDPAWMRPYAALLACIGGDPVRRLLSALNNFRSDDDPRVGDTIIDTDGELSIQSPKAAEKWEETLPEAVVVQ
ncbi:glycosyltransferase family 2 protein [Halobaculum magnesiiphilum]|uniref:Glycosyltransferase family 2 protein n=1 Tax=Halobaculum magnesiiphilum TaxID=1017351 RepID=A0A8T8WET6_9EURY|nr:glycosyltransferase family 2 protein [Halobaculum magnesiiphilum]QZP38244.1 glycosyltransferase family 2 protein [Halobaculum magnesiiphilum]